MVTITDLGENFRKVGQDFHYRAGDLQKLVKEAPQQIGQLKAYGDYFIYIGDEIDRAASCGIDLTSSPGLNVTNVQQTMTWNVASPLEIGNTITVASGTSGATADMMATYVEEDPSFGLFQNPPESFLQLKITDQTVLNLNEVKPGLGVTWQSAWDAINVGSAESVKSAAISARIAVDEISRKPPYDHLKTLRWCKLDDKGQPTRASRYAWILHGDDLPPERAL